MPKREPAVTPSKIVWPIDLQRLRAGQRAVLAAMGQVRQSFGPRPDPVAVASLYTEAVLAADDGYSRAVGLIVQHDEVVWADLVAAHALFGPHVEASTHGGVGTWHPNCAECEAVGAFGRIRGRIDWPGWP